MRFEALGSIDDLNQSLALSTEPVDPNDPEYVRHINNVGVGLQYRFSRFGWEALDDLDCAVALYESLLSDSRIDRAMILNNFSNIFKSRFDLLGEIEDLNRCIEFKREAVAIPGGNMNLNGLGGALLVRFDVTGNMDELTNAIEVLEEAFNFTTSPAERIRCFTNFALALSS